MPPRVDQAPRPIANVEGPAAIKGAAPETGFKFKTVMRGPAAETGLSSKSVIKSPAPENGIQTSMQPVDAVTLTRTVTEQGKKRLEPIDTVYDVRAITLPRGRLSELVRKKVTKSNPSGN